MSSSLTKLTTNTVLTLLRGASVLACGGGLDWSQQRQLCSQAPIAPALEKGVPIIDSSELDADQWCVTVSEVGAAGASVMSKERLPNTLALLEAKTGRTVTALIPGEIGQEAITLQAAAQTGLPIVNSDLSGCRAVPRLTDLALVVKGVDFQFSPMVILQRDGTQKFVPELASLNKDEAQVRKLVPVNEIVTMVGGFITGRMVQQHLAYDSLTTTLALGKRLQTQQPLAENLPTKALYGPATARITAITEESNQGFTVKEATLETAADTLQLTVENEYMQLQSKEKTYEFPQLIMLYDAAAGWGLHSSELTEGMDVQIIVAKAFDFWQNREDSS